MNQYFKLSENFLCLFRRSLLRNQIMKIGQ